MKIEPVAEGRRWLLQAEQDLNDAKRKIIIKVGEIVKKKEELLKRISINLISKGLEA